MAFWNRSWFESWLPLAASLSFVLASHFFRTEISSAFGASGWSESNLYTAVFDWSAIQSGFMFAIYGFIVTKKDGFAGEIVKGISYEKFVSFTKRACVGGFFLTILSLPLLVTAPDIDDSESFTFYLVISWFAFFLWAFLAFLRVAFSFGIIVATKDRPQKTPG